MEETASPISLIVAGLLFIMGIGSFVCWIMVIVKAFKSEQSPLMGILSIVLCGLGAFIIGWIHAGKWGITKLMTIWTILFVGTILIQVLFGAALATLTPQETIVPEGLPQ